MPANLRPNGIFANRYLQHGAETMLTHLELVDSVLRIGALVRYQGDCLCNPNLSLMDDPAYWPDGSDKPCKKCHEIAQRHGLTIARNSTEV